MGKTKHIGSWPRRRDYSLDAPPPIATIRTIARAEGYALKRSAKTGLCWLVVSGTSRLASPERGLTLHEVWIVLALPSVDPRVEAIMGHT